MTSILDYMHQVKDNADARNDAAFMLGARETSTAPVIFVDIDAIDAKTGSGELEQLKDQLDGQVPGAFDVLITKKLEMVRRENPEITRADILSSDPNMSDANTPGAINKIMIEGQEYCIVLKPSDITDSKEEFINRFTTQFSPEIREKIISNIPGDDKDWNLLMANHEGGHCNSREEQVNIIDDHNEELYADRIAIDLAHKRGQVGMALAWKDIRHLDDSSRYQKHATGVLLNSGDSSSDLHIIEASTYKAAMDKMVNDNFDWGKYEGEATSPRKLLEENSDLYFQTVHAETDALKVNVMNAYNKDMSDGNIGDVISAQIRIDYMENFEDAYRRRAMGQDIPEREPTQLIPKEVEDAYIERQKDKDYQTGLDGTPYTTEVSGIAQGEPTVDFENGVSVNDTAIPEIFAQSASPVPEDIKLVNAKMLPPENQVIPPIPADNDSEYDKQNFG